jgi:hypothetical protein
MDKFFKRLVAVVLAVLLVGSAGMIGAGASQTVVPSGYTGIYNATDLNNIRNNLSGKYILMSDVDIGSMNWSPIGASNSTPFTGVLDGNGYSIKNLTIDVTSNQRIEVALFGYISGGSVTNLGLFGGSVKAKVTAAGVSINAAPLACRVTNTSTIENCYSTVNVTVMGTGATSDNSGVGIAGGLIVYLQNKSSVTNCFVRGDVSVTEFYNTNLGGLVGGMTDNSLLDNCFYAGKITAGPRSTSAAYMYIGSIVGYDMAGAGTISNCYYISTFATATGYRGGSTTRTNLVARTEAEMKTATAYPTFDFTSVWAIDTSKNGGFPYLQGLAVPSGGSDPQPTTYTITYNANGGTGAPASQIKTQGVAMTLSSTIPIKSGYTFKGWSISNVSTTAQYQAGGSYTANESITLYAVWEGVPLRTANIRFPVFNSTPQNSLKKTVAVPWDDRMFEQPATQFSQSLAKTAMALSAASYDVECITQAFPVLGFSNWRYFDKGNNNMNCFYIAQKTITVNGQTKNLIIVVLRGTSGGFNEPEWLSNFATPFLDGFQNYADEVLTELRGYISNSSEDKVLITGHSRGAAAANILGVEVNNAGLSKQSNTYIYTFATPNTTRYPVENQNIFNIINAEDSVAIVPPLYSKNGITYAFHRQKSPLMKATFRELTNGLSLDPIMDSLWIGDIPKRLAYAHAQETYLSLLLPYDENGESLHDIYEVKRSIIACPVDVTIYNEANNLVGKVVNNKVEVMTGHVMIVVDGDIKYIYTPTAEKYRLELLATDTGQMNYTVEDVDFTNQTASSQKQFQSVALTTGKKMTSTIAGTLATPDVALYVVDDSGNKIRQVQPNGTETNVTQAKGIFGTNAKWYGAWWHYLLFFLCFGFVWMWF